MSKNCTSSSHYQYNGVLKLLPFLQDVHKSCCSKLGRDVRVYQQLQLIFNNYLSAEEKGLPSVASGAQGVAG